jgi:hypothetical protein
VEIDLTIDQLLSQNPSVPELKATFERLPTHAATSGEAKTANIKAVMQLPIALKTEKALIDCSNVAMWQCGNVAIAMLKRSEQLLAAKTMAMKS